MVEIGKIVTNSGTIIILDPEILTTPKEIEKILKEMIEGKKISRHDRKKTHEAILPVDIEKKQYKAFIIKVMRGNDGVYPIYIKIQKHGDEENRVDKIWIGVDKNTK